MATITLTSKRQLTTPRQLREALGVVLPSKYKQEDLFQDRSTVNRMLTIDEMARATNTGALPVLSFERRFAASEGVELLRSS